MLRTLSTELVIAEMRLGTPVIYVDYRGYDAIGHHSGPERPESLHAVRGIDRAIARLMTAAERAARPYRLVVLSDHGQSLGIPFAQQYGQRLDQFVAAGMGADVASSQMDAAEHGHTMSLVLRELGGGVGVAQVASRGTAALNRLVRAVKGHPDEDTPELVVCASGNLAHLYFTTDPARMTRDEMERRYPGIVDHLLRHPAIGLVMVRDAAECPIVLGAAGQRVLRSGRVAGGDPLRDVRPGAAASLLRLDSFMNTGDIVVISGMDAETGNVTFFEALVGCHGGLGGAQDEPFLLYPSEWRLGSDPIEGADAVHLTLRSWLEDLGHR